MSKIQLIFKLPNKKVKKFTKLFQLIKKNVVSFEQYKDKVTFLKNNRK